MRGLGLTTNRFSLSTVVSGRIPHSAFRVTGLILLLVAFHPSFVTHSFAQGIITTVAGSSHAFQGNGGPASNATLGWVASVAFDSTGNLYAADSANHLVVKISGGGILTVVAGNGVSGYSGDGGQATSASLNIPQGVVLDGAGNLYISESGNHRIRRVTPQGIITTVAGDGIARYAGDGGPATGASLNFPSGMALDTAGNLYVADSVNNRIRKIDASGIITTVAGGGATFADGVPAVSASLVSPFSVAFDAAGNLYIADGGSDRIRRVTPQGLIQTIAGSQRGFGGDGGPAISALLNEPKDVKVDGTGNVYVADRGNHRIRRIAPNGTIATVAGSASQGFSGDGGPATAAALLHADGIVTDATGILYIADSENYRIRRVSADGIISTIAGNGQFGFSGDGGAAILGEMRPTRVAVDASGSYYISELNNHRIRKVSPTGILSTLAGDGQPGFRGDGGLATAASLTSPYGVALDSAGNVFIADSLNHRIRKVSPAGIITTVAGNGAAGYSGDGGPALNASLSEPRDVVIDGAGNLYIADTFNSRIRKVTPTGTITTVAGGGATFAEGVPATSFQLTGPMGVTVDLAGNLYIADTFASRIRKVSPAGTITTIAGGGTALGDGGPALSAALLLPTFVALDQTGNLYIADTFQHRIRKVSLDGIITTVAGDGVAALGGDGGLSTSASLSFPFGVAVKPGGGLLISDSGNDRIREVLAAAPAFSSSPVLLSFTAPADSPVNEARLLNMGSSLLGLVWNAQTSTESGGNWLRASPSLGISPGTVSVSVNTVGLSPGSYRGRVTLAAPGAVPPVRTADVELAVQPGLPPRLLLDSPTMTFEGEIGTANPPSQTLHISNAGAGQLDWTAVTETTTGGNWLTVSQTSGSASAASPVNVQVHARMDGLQPGVFSGSVRVRSTANDEVVMGVTLIVRNPTQVIATSRTSLWFIGVEGGSSIPPQTVAVLNAGTGTMAWRLETATLSGGNWLTATPSAGQSAAHSVDAQVAVGVTVTGLAEGQYSGSIRVLADGANNSPQTVSVLLVVLPRGSTTGVRVSPSGLIFSGQAGGSSPSSQLLRLTTASASGVEVQVSASTASGGNWLQILPDRLIVSSSEPGIITVQPLLTNLPGGLYRGSLNLLYSDGTPTQVVEVIFLVRPIAAAVSRQGLSGLGGRAVNGCTPTSLLAVMRTITDNFRSPLGWPTILETRVIDDCGEAVSNAAVVASFSSGDAPLVLAAQDDGSYVGHWLPVNARDEMVVTLRAERPPLRGTEVRIQGQVRAVSTASSSLFAGGVVDGASFASGRPVAPGSIISVFGRRLSAGVSSSPRLPLESTLGGATLTIGGKEAPLFFASDGQINAQVPFEVRPNSRSQVVLRTTRETDGSQALAVPETITIAEARPAIFTVNQAGTGQAAVLNQDSSPNSASNAAARGSVIQIFATGLGATNPAVPSGQPAPGNPPALVTSPVAARIGGQSATVQFAGLAPGFVGLYQVNVVVPPGVPPGSEVTLTLTQNGVPSNTVTVAIQ